MGSLLALLSVAASAADLSCQGMGFSNGLLCSPCGKLVTHVGKEAEVRGSWVTLRVYVQEGSPYARMDGINPSPSRSEYHRRMMFAIVTRWGGCRPCGMSTISTVQKIGSCADSGKDARRRDLEELVSFTGVSRHRSTEV